MTEQELKKIEDIYNATLTTGEWIAMPDSDNGGFLDGYISAGQSKEGYSLDVIISENEIQQNVDFIITAHRCIPLLIAAVRDKNSSSNKSNTHKEH